MDEDSTVGDPHLFSHLGNSAKFLLNEPSDRHRFVAEIDLQEIVDLAHFGPAVNQNVVLP